MVILDVGGRDEPISPELLKVCDIVSPNETEFQRVIEGTIDDAAIEDFLANKIKAGGTLLLKLGEHGASHVSLQKHEDGNKSSRLQKMVIPAHKEGVYGTNEYKIVDTTGAGDCYTGAFTI